MKSLSRVTFLLIFLLFGCAPVKNNSSNSPYVDLELERTALARIFALRQKNIKVSVTSFNKHLLLTGDVPNESVRSEIARVVSAIQDVRGVSNELEIGEVSSIISSSGDSFITSNVKLRIAKKTSVDVREIKIITVNKTVYLMGSLDRKSASTVADVASTAGDVLRVVKVFEYLD